MTEAALNGDRVGRLMDVTALARTLSRLAHEVRERHPGLEGVVLAGIREGGVPIAGALAAALAEDEPGTGAGPPLLALDVTGYRDDRPRPVERGRDAISLVGPTAGEVEVTDRVVILVDDVLHTGRTLRAALDLLVDRGRPAAVELLVLFDRGQRELPLRATYVGRNIPVAPGQWVEVVLDAVAADRRGAWLMARRPVPEAGPRVVGGAPR